MNSQPSVSSNIWKYYLVTSLAQFAFYTPIIQLFYLANNLSVFKIAMLGVTWGLVKMALEVPSSVLADKWERKNVLIISTAFAILSIIILIYATSYWMFVLASALSAVSFAFASGTDLAFFYDTLKELKKDEDFDKLWARQSIYHQIPLVLAFASSGFLYKFSALLPFQLSLIFLVLSLIIMFTFIEPKNHKPIKEVSIFSHLKQSAQFIFKNQYLRTILFFTLLFCLGNDLSYGYGQIYLALLALPIVLFGIVYTIKSLIVAVIANFTPLLRRRFSYKTLFGFQIISQTILLYVMVLTKSYITGALCFILISVPFGFFIISKSSYMHQNIKSHQRATIDSMFSFLVATMFLIVEPITGYLTDLYTIKIPFLLVAIIMSLYCVYYVFLGHKKIE